MPFACLALLKVVNFERRLDTVQFFVLCFNLVPVSYLGFHLFWGVFFGEKYYFVISLKKRTTVNSILQLCH